MTVYRRQPWVGALIAVVVGLALPAWARGAESAAQRLAVTYSPVLSRDPQAKPCGPGEAYRPTTVDIVLGRQDVMLRNPAGGLVTRAPTSSDLGFTALVDTLAVLSGPLLGGCCS